MVYLPSCNNIISFGWGQKLYRTFSIIIYIYNFINRYCKKNLLFFEISQDCVKFLAFFAVFYGKNPFSCFIKGILYGSFFKNRPGILKKHVPFRQKRAKKRTRVIACVRFLKVLDLPSPYPLFYQVKALRLSRRRLKPRRCQEEAAHREVSPSRMPKRPLRRVL